MAGHLTARKVETAKPGKYGDGANLYLVVSKTGARKWVLRFTWRSKSKEMGLGGAASVPLTIRTTRHGPLITDVYGLDKFSQQAGLDASSQYALSLRWTAPPACRSPMPVRKPPRRAGRLPRESTQLTSASGTAAFLRLAK